VSGEPTAAARRIVLLRHGRTAWNAATRIQGQLEEPQLDELGRAQARAVAPEVAALAPARIWSSDLSRARETTAELLAATGLVATYDERLREFHLGDRQGLTHAEYRELAPEEFARFRAGDWAGIPGAEHPEDAAKRFAAAVQDLTSALAPGETGVAVSHGAVTRVGLVAFLGWPLEVARGLGALGNCARVELVEHPGRGWTVAAYNLPPAQVPTPIS